MTFCHVTFVLFPLQVIAPNEFPEQCLVCRMLVYDIVMGLFKVNLVVISLAKSSSPVSPHVLCLLPFQDTSISFQFDAVAMM